MNDKANPRGVEMDSPQVALAILTGKAQGLQAKMARGDDITNNELADALVVLLLTMAGGIKNSQRRVTPVRTSPLAL